MPLEAIVSGRQPNFQRATEQRQAQAIMDGHPFRAPLLAPFVELLRDPVAMLVNERLNLGEGRPVGGTDT